MTHVSVARDQQSRDTHKNAMHVACRAIHILMPLNITLAVQLHCAHENMVQPEYVMFQTPVNVVGEVNVIRTEWSAV